MLTSCDYRELQPGRYQYLCKETNQMKEWYPREIYGESQHLSFAETNVPFAHMLYNAKKMRTAKADEVKTILTYLCCFMEAEAAWEKRKVSLSKKALSRPVNTAIHEMVNKSLDRVSELRPTEIKRCRF